MIRLATIEEPQWGMEPRVNKEQRWKRAWRELGTCHGERIIASSSQTEACSRAFTLCPLSLWSQGLWASGSSEYHMVGDISIWLLFWPCQDWVSGERRSRDASWEPGTPIKFEDRKQWSYHLVMVLVTIGLLSLPATGGSDGSSVWTLLSEAWERYIHIMPLQEKCEG